LTFQVKGTGSRSDEAMGHLQDYVCPGTFGTFSQRHTLNAIPLAKRDDLLTLHVHNGLLTLTGWVINTKPWPLYHAFSGV
jgi:hypothetical protein